MKLRNYILSLFIVLTLFGCDKEPICPGGPGCEPTENSHTLLMYMVVDNDGLWSFMRNNVNGALRAVEKGLPDNTRILVYYDGRISGGEMRTALTELVKDGNGKAYERILKEYNWPEEMGQVEVMQNVLVDLEYYAAAEAYGIAFGTHGTGWLPTDLSNIRYPASAEDENLPEHEFIQDNDAFMTRSMGVTGKLIDMKELAEGLSSLYFDYIMFDVCFMSSVEGLYELRNSASYVLASPIEIMGRGIPYDIILPILTDRLYTIEQRLQFTSNAVVNYYLSNTDGYPKSFALAVIRMDRMQRLADAVKNVFAAGVGEPEVDDIVALEMLGREHAFFDLQDYLYNITKDQGAEAVRAFDDFKRTLSDVVIWYNHTPEGYSAMGYPYYFDIRNTCGVSSYIPRDHLPKTKEAYFNSAWGKYIRPDGM